MQAPINAAETGSSTKRASQYPGSITALDQRPAAVATTVLPDGRPVAVTGSDDGTVRIWDLTTGTAIGGPLSLPGAVTAIAIWETLTGAYVAVTGDGIVAFELRPGSL